MDTIIQQVKGHLGSAIAQSIASDDQIIMDHVKAAYTLLGALGPHYHVAGASFGQSIDTCTLCGMDIFDEIHMRG